MKLLLRYPIKYFFWISICFGSLCLIIFCPYAIMFLGLKWGVTSKINYVPPDNFNLSEDSAILFGSVYNQKSDQTVLNWPNLHKEETICENCGNESWSAFLSSCGDLYYCSREHYSSDLIVRKSGLEVESVLARGESIWNFSLSPNQDYLIYTQGADDISATIEVVDLSDSDKLSVSGYSPKTRATPAWLSNSEVAFVCAKGITTYSLETEATDLIVTGNYSSVVFWREDKLLVTEDEKRVFVFDLQTRKKEFLFKNRFACGPPTLSPCSKYLAFTHEFTEDVGRVNDFSRADRAPTPGASVCIVNLETMEYTYYSRPSGYYGPYLSWAHLAHDDYAKTFED